MHQQFNLINQPAAIKKQPLLSFADLMVYSAALTVIVAQLRDNVMRKIN
ncbi:hypothetical protein ACQ3G7_10365 [Kosakonia oryzendophytica]